MDLFLPETDCGNLWNYDRDEVNDAANNKILNNNITTSKSF